MQPTPDDIIRLIHNTRPAIEDLFVQHRISPEEAEVLLHEALTLLLLRDEPAEEAWLLRMLERAIRLRRRPLLDPPPRQQP